MSLEVLVKGTLDSLVGSRVYPDVTPDNPTFPLIVYQQVGGEVAEYLEATAADMDNARLRLSVWAKTRLETTTLARQARLAMVEGFPLAVSIGAPISVYDDVLKLYGSHQDLGVWYDPAVDEVELILDGGGDPL